MTIRPDRYLNQIMSEPNPDVRRSMGGDNTFSLRCESNNSLPNYAGCLHTREQMSAGNPSVNQACVNAIKAGTCAALVLRREELKKGHSIYFYSRAEQVAQSAERIKNTPRYGFRANRVRTELPTQSYEPSVAPTRTLAKPTSKPSGIDPNIAGSNLIGEAINRVMSEQS